jgi:hypothetical protein
VPFVEKVWDYRKAKELSRISNEGYNGGSCMSRSELVWPELPKRNQKVFHEQFHPSNIGFVIAAIQERNQNTWASQNADL